MTTYLVTMSSSYKENPDWYPREWYFQTEESATKFVKKLKRAIKLLDIVELCVISTREIHINE